MFLIAGVQSVRCESSVGPCTFRYFVALDESDSNDPNRNPFLDIHVEFLRCKQILLTMCLNYCLCLLCIC